MEVRGEDAGVLVDGAVLDDDVLLLGDLHHVLETLVQEVDLQVEGPPLHVFVEVGEVGVEVDGLELRGPPVVGGEHLGQRGLSAADISGDGDMHNSVYLRKSSNYFRTNHTVPRRCGR